MPNDVQNYWEKSNFMDLTAHGVSLPQAAAAVGRSTRTIYRWLAEDPAFKRRYYYERTRAETDPLDLIRRHADQNWRAAVYLHQQAVKRARKRRKGGEDPAEHLLSQVEGPLQLLIGGMAEKLHRVPDEQLRNELLGSLKLYADHVGDVMGTLWGQEVKRFEAKGHRSEIVESDVRCL